MTILNDFSSIGAKIQHNTTQRNQFRFHICFCIPLFAFITFCLCDTVVLFFFLFFFLLFSNFASSTIYFLSHSHPKLSTKSNQFFARLQYFDASYRIEFLSICFRPKTMTMTTQNNIDIHRVLSLAWVRPSPFIVRQLCQSRETNNQNVFQENE